MQPDLLARGYLAHELRAHLRKDLQLMFSSSSLVLLIAAMLALGFIFAYNTSLYFFDSYSYRPVTGNELHELYADSIIDYWGGILFIWPIFVAMIAALFMSREKEGGMFGYILTYRPRGGLMYLSKFLVLSFVLTLIVLASAVIFQLVFFFNNGSFFPLFELLGTCAYPLFGMIILSQLCLLICLLAKKGNTGLIATMCIVLLLAVTLNTFMGLAWNEMNDNNEFAPYDPDLYPVEYRIAILLNPMFLQEGVISAMNVSNDYQSGTYYQGYFQAAGPDLYWTYIAVSVILYAAVSIGVIQRNVPRRKERSG